MRKIKTNLSLKTICELDFYAGENLYMIDPDESKFGCIASEEYNYTGKFFGPDAEYSVIIDGEDIGTRFIYANDITGTVVRYKRDKENKVEFCHINGVEIEVLRGNVKIKILNKEDSKNEE